MVAHADWYAPAPVQIPSASTDAAKKAELVSQRAALINEGKANPIASTRKEYLDMKARHCRPRAVTEHLALSRTQPQRSALSLSIPQHRVWDEPQTKGPFTQSTSTVCAYVSEGESDSAGTL